MLKFISAKKMALVDLKFAVLRFFQFSEASQAKNSVHSDTESFKHL